MAYVTYLMDGKKKADPSLTWEGMWYDLTMKNVMELSSDLSRVVGFLPQRAWSFLIKHFIPPILLILFFLGADATTLDAHGNTVKVFGNYGGYPISYQVLGVLTVVFASFLFVSSLVFPKMYDALQELEKCPDETIQVDPQTSYVEMNSVNLAPENEVGEKVAPEGHLA